MTDDNLSDGLRSLRALAERARGGTPTHARGIELFELWLDGFGDGNAVHAGPHLPATDPHPPRGSEVPERSRAAGATQRIGGSIPVRQTEDLTNYQLPGNLHIIRERLGPAELPSVLAPSLALPCRPARVLHVVLVHRSSHAL